MNLLKRFAAAALIALVLPGCGRKSEGPSGNAADESKKTASHAAAARAPVATGDAAKPIDGKVVPHLTLLLRQFVHEKGRQPQNLLEFIGAKVDSLPMPPEGHTYAIDPVTVEIKLVKL